MASQNPSSSPPLLLLRPTDLLDELCAEVALEAHREHKTGSLLHVPPGPPPPKPVPLDPLPGVKGPTDVFGQVRKSCCESSCRGGHLQHIG